MEPPDRSMIRHQSKSKKPGSKVFISHAQADQELARGLAEVLRRAHFEPWLDEEALQPGDNWAKGIGRALETSDAIVVLVSKDLLRSPQRHEWDFAIGSGKHAGRVVPVLTPGTEIDSVPWIIKHIQHVKAGRDWKRATRQVVNKLRELARAG